MSTRSRRALASAMALWAFLLPAHDVHAMSPDQMKKLAGAGLLGLPADAVFRRCRLPAAIVDAVDPSHKKRTVRWGEATMQLSASDWNLLYGRRQRPTPRESAWINSGPGGNACLSADLSELVLRAKGGSGVLSVKKRADNQGYVTTYRVPDDLYAAHRVTEVTGRWKTGLPIAEVRQRYGDPDEVVKDGDRVRFNRYWVIERNDKQMPTSLHAVDFEIDRGGKTATGYILRSSDVEFVQQKLDALLRQWEKDYVLD